jgi:hypothetical protein
MHTVRRDALITFNRIHEAHRSIADEVRNGQSQLWLGNKNGAAEFLPPPTFNPALGASSQIPTVAQP